MVQITTKTLPLASAELKFASDAPAGQFSGYASVFGGVDAYGDTIVPGAYRKTLESRERPIHMRDNHVGPIIGKWLEMAEDRKGLFVRGELTPGHSVAQDRYASMQHGTMTGLSIGFRIPPGGAKSHGNLRELHEIDLLEISVVEDPADLAAQIGEVKAAVFESPVQFQRVVRDTLGLSNREAKALARGGWDALMGNDESQELAQIADQLKLLNTEITR